MIVNKKKLIAECIVVFFLLGFCEWFFFRNIVVTGNGALIGDRGDGRLTNLIAEHWWKFFQGKEKFTEIAMFYPVREAIGYSDLLIGYGLPYSLFRLAGINMFAAYKWTIVVICAAGSLAMYYLLRKKLKLDPVWAFFGTIAFCCSDTFARHLFHTQLAAASCLPVLLIFIIGFFENPDSRFRRNIYAYLFLSVFILLTYTSWYTAYFAVIFSLFFIIIFLLCLLKKKTGILPVVREWFGLILKDIPGYLLFSVILFIPFIMIYLPVLKTSQNHLDFAKGLPEAADIINVTETNFLLGGLMKHLDLDSRGYSMEIAEGYSIVLLCLFILTLVVFTKKVRKSEKMEHPWKSSLISAAFFTIIFIQFSLTKLSANGVSLWMLLYKIIPAAKSLRAVARFMLWMSFPMAVITSYMADRLFSGGKKINRVFAVCAVLLLFVSNINKIGVSQQWNKPDEWRFLTTMAEPPDDAESFYIVNSSGKCGNLDALQIDAYEIASWFSLKTVNGYSGNFPADWGLWNPCGKNYQKNIAGWIERYGLTNVYAYDRSQNIWIRHESESFQ